VSPVLRDVVVGKNRFYRTLRNTRVTIDAGIGVDVEAIWQFMKCFDRANRGAVRVLAVNTWFHHYVSHQGETPFRFKTKCLFTLTTKCKHKSNIRRKREPIEI
jgi:hypothetical protein